MNAPPAGAKVIDLPSLETDEALADWLGISVGKLQWYADLSGRNCNHNEGPLRPYRYRWVTKQSGQSRLLEIPKTRLKAVQRKILAGILDKIPPHSSAHGFCQGRSIITNASLHCGKSIVIRFDLADFFTSVSGARIARIFQTFGYPDHIANFLCGLTTTLLPLEVWRNRPHPAQDGSDYRKRLRLESRHLPQGAPTSPALANLSAFRLDRRLSKLAGSLDADYTRYADDLVFSGGEELARGTRRFGDLVKRIVEEEGFLLNETKTQVMRKNACQQVTGVIVNVTTNFSRREYDQLKAILTNCIRHGPANQNRENHPDFQAHLSGRIAFLSKVHVVRGRKLWILFDRISWPKATGSQEK